MTFTDTELNEAVARKLGLIWVADSGKESTPAYPPLKDYCRSIAAAWEIVEFLRKQRVSVMISCFYENNDPDDGDWDCELHQIEPIDGLFSQSGESDTAPRAICEAFLRLKDK